MDDVHFTDLTLSSSLCSRRSTTSGTGLHRCQKRITFSSWSSSANVSFTQRYHRRHTTSSVQPLTLVFVVFVASTTLTVSFFGDAKVVSTQMTQRIIETRYGRVRGLLVELPSDSGLPPVEAYLGLEYGSLYGGDLRFLPPTSPSTRWDNVRLALKFKPVCPQPVPDLDQLAKSAPAFVVEHIRRILSFTESQQEDCLYLNVYVPSRDKNDTSVLPVALFVHGESYQFGTGNAYDGSVMAAFGRIVVVTINYRLGVLGFLSTGDVHAPGNYALLDLIAALHWISDNIRPFGGDPSNVTLIGHGMGGALVNLLLLSPATSGRSLFSRAIIHSGSALSTWATVNSDTYYYSRLLSDRLNCSSAINHQPSLPSLSPPSNTGPASKSFEQPRQPLTTRQLVQCLRRFTADQLIQASNSLPPPPKFTAGFGPTMEIDSEVLPADSVEELIGRVCRKSPTLSSTGLPDVASTSSAFDNVDLLLGVSNYDGYKLMAQSDLQSSSTPLSTASSSSGIKSSTSTASSRVSADDLNEQLWQRTLRTYVQNCFRYHRQKIYDVLDHNYRNLISDGDSFQTGSTSGHLTMKIDVPSTPRRDSSAKSQPSPSKSSPRSGSSPAASVPDDSTTSDQHLQPIENIAALLGDGQFVAPTVAMAYRHSTCNIASRSDNNPAATFLYSFEIPSSRRGRIDGHGLLPYLFGAPLVDGFGIFEIESGYSADSKKSSAIVLTYFVNFIRTGNPNVVDNVYERLSPLSGLSSIVEWPIYRTDTQYYMVFGGSRQSARRRLKSRQMALWNDLLPRLHRPDDFDSKFHVLDYNVDNNETQLADNGSTSLRHQIELMRDDWFLQQQQQQQQQPRPRTLTVATLSALYENKTPHPIAFTAMTSSSDQLSHGRTSRMATDMPPGFTAPPSLDPTEFGHVTSDDDSYSHQSASFLMTVVVGSGLLVMNVVVFAIVLCQWRALRRVRAARIEKMLATVSASDRNSVPYSTAATSVCALVCDGSEHDEVLMSTFETFDRYVATSPTAAAAAAAVYNLNGGNAVHTENSTNHISTVTSFGHMTDLHRPKSSPSDASSVTATGDGLVELGTGSPLYRAEPCSHCDTARRGNLSHTSSLV